MFLICFTFILDLHVEDSINVNNINDKPTKVIYPVNVLEMAKENGNKLIFEVSKETMLVYKMRLYYCTHLFSNQNSIFIHIF